MSREVKFKVNDSAVTEQALKNLGGISMFIAMEEMSELQKEISKMERGKGDPDHVAEEICDVVLAITWIMARYNIKQEQVDKWLDFKANRIIDRVERGELS